MIISRSAATRVEPSYRDLLKRLSELASPKAPEQKPAVAPATKLAGPVAEGVYVVQSGDSLSVIAGRALGDAYRWPEIFELNRGLIGNNPNLIHPGMKLVLPGDPAPAPAPPPPPPEPEAPTGNYVVQSGDSLAAIAERHLGSWERWPELYERNRDRIGPSPDLLPIGIELELPGAPGRAPAPKPAPAPSAPTKREAPYINQYNPAGKEQGYWNGQSNCGPASMAMIARAFGYGGGLSDAKLINHLGEMGGTSAAGTNVNGIAAIARGIGKSAETRGPGPNVAWIAEQLRAGKLVVANGDYYAWHPNQGKIGTGGHYVAVVGIDGNGNFKVHDPADRAIDIISPAELERFIRSNSNGGYQIAVG